MYAWALTFFIAAILAAGVGFTHVWQKGVQIARLMFVIFSVVFLMLFYMIIF